MRNEDKSEHFDHRETYDTVLDVMVEKIAKVCRAFGMPFVIAIQTQNTEELEESRGQMFTPPHSMNTVGIAGHIAASRNSDDMKARIMGIAATIAMHEMRGEQVSELREMFKSLAPKDGDDNDKQLN